MEITAADLLKNAGLRRTEVREIVLMILKDAGRPLSHQEITSKKIVATFDRVTVYRTLESLQEVKLLHKVLGDDCVWRFCAHRDDNEKSCGGGHIHFLCRDCNQISCMPEQPLPWITAPKGAKIESKQLLVHGICAKCVSKNK